jgi:thiamine pyrophosphokinase
MGRRPTVIVADGDLDPGLLSRALDARDGAVPFVIAADAGANKAAAAGLRPDLVVGDADSLGTEGIANLERQGIPVEVSPVAKDESDTELAMLAAVARGATEIRIVGALGGDRVEHGVANLLLLAHPSLDGIDVAILTGPSTIRRIGTADGPGQVQLRGRAGDQVSLLPVDTVVDRVRTEGLRYPLRDEPLRIGPARGLSNELIGDVASVTTGRGRLLVIHTPRAADHKPGEVMP